MMFPLVLNIPYQILLRRNMISESAVSNLPSGKVRKYLVVLQNHYMTTKLYILDQVSWCYSWMYVLNNMNMIACSANNIRMTGFIFQNAYNI
jgi:hypothetical protein